MPIRENIQAVYKRIEGAAARAGRDPNDVVLIVVTKNQPVSAIREVLDSGIKDLGENRSQEVVSKYEEIGDYPTWHFIGHLQRNKVRYIIPFINLIQSVDSIALAREVDKRAAAIDKIQDILLEVNVSGEATKHGFAPEEIISALDEMVTLRNIYIKGLMMMAPFIEDEGLLRSYFAATKQLFDNLSSRQGPNVEMRYLSMGMTNDFEVAVEEGSNMVRIGTAIFKP